MDAICIICAVVTVFNTIVCLGAVQRCQTIRHLLCNDELIRRMEMLEKLTRQLMDIDAKIMRVLDDEERGGGN